MKKLLLSAAVLALLTSPAIAGENKMDTDGDGVVSKSEFMAKQETRFDEMDANNDGSIEKSEFKAAREKYKETRKERREERKEKKSSDSE